VKRQIGVPVLTDVHEYTPLNEVAAVVDVLQTPAFPVPPDRISSRTCRRRQAGEHQEGPVPRAVGNAERGRQGEVHGNTTSWCASAASSFGYNNLVSDMRSLSGDARYRLSGGVRRHALGAVAGRQGHQFRRPARIRAGTGARGGRRWRVSGLFAETHPDPSKALSDGPNAWPLAKMEDRRCNAPRAWRASITLTSLP
jgi:2-dehydro-3-deoxyphosphooctonate aldolase (KDO 8-P synthase)